VKVRQNFTQDSKKINHDFEHHTELYGVLIGDENHPQNLSSDLERESLIQIDVNFSQFQVNLTIADKYIS
jgi:hypothetical protein